MSFVRFHDSRVGVNQLLTPAALIKIHSATIDFTMFATTIDQPHHPSAAIGNGAGVWSMVHISDAAGPEEVEALRAQLAQLQPSHKHKVLETATLTAGFAVVTEFLPGALSFGSWLAQYAELPEASEVAPPQRDVPDAGSVPPVSEPPVATPVVVMVAKPG